MDQKVHKTVIKDKNCKLRVHDCAILLELEEKYLYHPENICVVSLQYYCG